ncbi:unnamed protein product [Ilex paraguariensis]|uniref:Uncharacterized protein n=1 Tax=Ilex paraguariensis TaxID=185542 RepID=A0ABC8TSS0_9AQUA
MLLALKAFTDQKRRFFPHLDDGCCMETASKKHCGASAVCHQEELSDLRTLSDILLHLEKEVPNVNIFTYQRLDWLKRASLLPSSAYQSSIVSSKEHNFHGGNNLRQGSDGTVDADKVAVIELLFPSVFRAIVSLHPAGSIEPDALAFFSPDEEGLHSRIGMSWSRLCRCRGPAILRACAFRPIQEAALIENKKVQVELQHRPLLKLQGKKSATHHEEN